MTIFFIIIAYLQIKRLVQAKLKRELIVYIVIMAIAVFYSWGILLNWNLFRPGSIISRIYQPISNYIFIQTEK
ncbi:hypothetical protein [Halonatronum saccharophilum]|uniref:hypothetical protein n=1 Tax=Halonatronum saccharophilum TaxID=150060 RepID=UPI001B7F8640|nr:hypothetical protein [Halonatronum saccharophilum]